MDSNNFQRTDRANSPSTLNQISIISQEFSLPITRLQHTVTSSGSFSINAHPAGLCYICTGNQDFR